MPLTTIVVATAVAIAFIDLNAALIVGLWVMRKIVLYIVVAFFLTLLLTPAVRFLKRHGLSHGVRRHGGLPGRPRHRSPAWSTSSPRPW